MDQKDWLVMPRDATPIRQQDSYTRLLEMMNRLEEERGYRFTDAQADTIKKLINGLIKQIKSTNAKRNAKNRFGLRRILHL